MNISGSISANHFIQIPNPQSLQKSLGLTGRYLYLQVKSTAGAPFSLHFDFAMAERGHNTRLSVSNLFKAFNQSTGFAVQVPLELRPERWTCVCLDIVELMSRSLLFPSSYSLDGAHTLKVITLCANVQIRGVYTSDNEYDFVTLPSDMRFKFPFDNQAQVSTKWLEYFDWQHIPDDWADGVEHKSARSKLDIDGGHLKAKGGRDVERNKMSQEID